MVFDSLHTSDPILLQTEIPVETGDILPIFDPTIQLKKLKNEIIERKKAEQILIEFIKSEYYKGKIGTKEYTKDIAKLGSRELPMLSYAITIPRWNKNLEPIKDAIIVLSQKNILRKLEFEYMFYEIQKEPINMVISIKIGKWNTPYIASINQNTERMDSTVEL